MIRKLDDTTSVSGQIQPADVAGLKASGISMIVCNRPDEEEPGQPTAAEVQQAARAQGIEFRHVPIIRGIGPSDVEAMQEALDAATGKLLAYCRTGNRSALTWAVARRGQGASVEEIRAAVTGAGYDLSPVEHLL
ncbi:MAG: TIGR01244 family sulfur transferase [Sphingomicrobium sp.]